DSVFGFGGALDEAADVDHERVGSLGYSLTVFVDRARDHAAPIVRRLDRATRRRSDLRQQVGVVELVGPRRTVRTNLLLQTAAPVIDEVDGIVAIVEDLGLAA